MVATIQQIPSSEDQYDMASGTVKQVPERWRIMIDQQTKRFEISNPNQPTAPFLFRDINTPNPAYIQVGFSQQAAAMIAWMLNH